jgi:hypothetical protein
MKKRCHATARLKAVPVQRSFEVEFSRRRFEARWPYPAPDHSSSVENLHALGVVRYSRAANGLAELAAVDAANTQ